MLKAKRMYEDIPDMILEYIESMKDGLKKLSSKACNICITIPASPYSGVQKILGGAVHARIVKLVSKVSAEKRWPRLLVCKIHPDKGGIPKTIRNFNSSQSCQRKGWQPNHNPGCNYCRIYI